jgi:hypothetical protein
MRDLQDASQSIPERVPSVQDEAVQTDIKKKDIDQMIEEFKKANPAKSQKKSYRGVF